LICQTSGIDLLDDSVITDHIYDGYEVEVRCNRFAGEFLVPDDDFIAMVNKIGTINDLQVEKFAKLYGVSREVIMRKLLNHRVITNGQYEEKSAEYRNEYFRFTAEEKQKSKGGGNYYSTQLTYKGRHYTELAFNGYYSQKFSVTQLAQYMGMKVSSVQSIASQKP
jgi:Zn-dependent peptidase ImmA (M78 family)